jgi:hypothetical protein
MATLNSSNIVNNNVIQTNDLLQLYNALNYTTTATPFLAEISGSLLGTASYCTTASFALNGGGGGGAVTQIIAGPNITISPAIGTGSVTISASGGGGSSFPFVGDAVITGSLVITGSNAGADLRISGSVNATEGFTGSLLGTATNTTLAVTATTGLTSSKVTITNNNLSASLFPIIFASSSTAGAQPLSFDNDANGPKINPANNSIEAFRFTGSLLGTASQAANSTLAATATSSLSASTVSNTTSTAAHFLTFVDTNNATATSEKLFTNSGLSFQPAINGGTLIASVLSASNISASSITASAGFTGSLLGTASNAVTSSFIRTTASAAATAQYLTFVDSNNTTNAPEQLSTNANLFFTPSTNILTIVGTVSASSYTGSLFGTASNATTASHANTASVPLTTTQWSTLTVGGNIPAGRDIGVVFNYTSRTGNDIFRLNTSSAQTGDQVQIATVGTYANGGLLIVSTSGSSAVSGSIIVAGYTNNPSTYSSVYSQYNDVSGSQSSWKFVCVAGGTKPKWQLVNYMDRYVAINGTWQLVTANNL